MESLFAYPRIRLRFSNPDIIGKNAWWMIKKVETHNSSSIISHSLL